MRFIFVCLCMTFTSQVVAQEYVKEVRGVVQDTSGIPLEGVNVRLTSVIDTLFTTTNASGQFAFSNVGGLEYRVTYSILGYQIQDRLYTINTWMPGFDFIIMKLKPQTTLLKEVIVYGVPPIQIKGDTIQYNASAFSVPDGVLLETLMKELPGIEVDRNGSVRAQGALVTRVKVNGKDFFGGNVLTATKNLPAEIVENVQIIDDYGEKAEFTGIKNSEPEKIVNITLKEDKNRGMFGQVTAGGGTNQRYIGSLSANSFNEDEQLSFIGSTNNTNASLYSFGDVSGAGSRESADMDLSSMIDVNDGINLTNSLGFNYRDDLSSNTTTYGGYVYTHRNNETEALHNSSTPFQNYVISNVNQLYSTNQNVYHKLNWVLESDLGKQIYLKVSPMITYNRGKSYSMNEQAITNRYQHTKSNLDNDMLSTTPAVDLEIYLNQKFKKPGRNMGMTIKTALFSLEKNDYVNDYQIKIDSSYQDPRIETEEVTQDIRNKQQHKNLQFELSYIEPFGKKSYLEVDYQYAYTSNESTRNTLWNGIINGEDTNMDSLRTDYSYQFQTNQIGFNYQYNHNKVSYTLGFAAQPVYLSGYTHDRDVITEKTNVNFIPSVRFSYKIDNLRSLTLSYNGRTNQPDIYQIQPVRDNTNSQNVILGNPDLQPEFINRFGLKYKSFNLRSGNAFFTTFDFESVQNKIVANRVSIPNSTRQETFFLNTKGYFNAHAYYLYSLAVIEDALNLSLSGSVDYNNNVSFINFQRSSGRNLLFTQGFQSKYKLDEWLEADLRGSYTLNSVRNTLPYLLSRQASSMTIGLGGRAYLGKWTLSVDAAHRVNNGFSDLVESNPTIVNLYLQRSFLKNDRAVIRLQAFDLLNQNTGITSEFNGVESIDMQTNRLARYFLLSFNLRLQKFPT